MSRFVVSSVTGYAISPQGGRSFRRIPPTIYYVLDSEYCFKVIRRFSGQGGRRRYPTAERPPETAFNEARALAYAAELNAQELA